MQDLVSVIIPTKNRPKMLYECIHSIIEQTYKRIEIIIVDDDHEYWSAEKCLLENFSNFDNIQYYKNPGMGGNSARNHGLAKAKGNFIAFCDDDDLFEKQKIELQLKLLITSNTGACYCYSKRIIVEKDIIMNEFIYKPPLPCRYLFMPLLLSYNFIGTQTLMCKKELLNTVNGFDENLKRMQDWDIVIRLAKVTDFVCVKVPLVKIRIHDNSRVSKLPWEHVSFIYRKHKNISRNFLTLIFIIAHFIRHGNTKKILHYFREVWLR